MIGKPSPCKKCGSERFLLKSGKPRCRTCVYSKQKEWRRNNADKVRAHNLSYYAANRDRITRQTREWYRATFEQRQAYAKGRRGRNPEQVRTWEQAHRARRKLAVGRHTTDEWLAIVKKQRGKCNACGKPEQLERDHIVPLSKGGSNFAFNIQGLCARCNSKKRASVQAGLQHSLFDRAVA